MVQAVNLRKVAIVLIALQCVGVSQVNATTSKPKPKVTTVKTAAPKKSTLTEKKVVPVKKHVVKRKHVYHKAVPKPVQPSPKPKWPPVGFTAIGTAFARVPTGQELIGLLSAMSDPTAVINSCSIDPKKPSAPAFACAAILVGSSQKCTWWRVSSTVKGIDLANPSGKIDLGQITTYEHGAAAKTIQTIFLVSPIPLQTGIIFTTIHAVCGIGPSTDPVPGTTFVPAPTPTLSTSDTPTPSPSPTSS